MTTLQSPIPSQPSKAVVRGAHWHFFLITAAALQLTACGGDDAMQSPPRSIIVKNLQQDPAEACDSQVNDTPEKLLECMTSPAVRAHQNALADIAKANNGTRMSGTAGYDASVAYARKVFEDAGYKVITQAFEFPVFSVESSSLALMSQQGSTAIAHKVLNYSGGGDVAAAVNYLRAPAGCNTSDFTGFPKGNIALIRRGGCNLTDKLTHAIAAGAAALVVYDPAGEELSANLSIDAPQDIPAVMIGKTAGEWLLQRAYQQGVQLHLKANTLRTMKTTHNVLAESAGGDPSNVAMVGAHLDSVAAGGGSNDNGSGVAAVLETARQMARVTPVNQLRFALWGAEEQGLLGSRHYTKNLDDTQKSKIKMYLNFDMIASPNYIFYVYAGDGSAGPKAISSPQSSAQMANVFADFYTQRNIPFKPLKLEARSDHQSFANIGIPFAGIFTGAEEIKSQQDASIWGGKPGVALDPCYHQACDDMSNYSEYALDINSDLVAYSTLFFAMNKLSQ